MNHKFQILREFEDTLINIENMMGIKQTTNLKLYKYGKLIFGDRFKGVYSADSRFKLKENEMCIINTDDSSKSGIHWLALIKYKGKIYCYDSFNRNYKFLSPYFTNKKWIVANKYVDEAIPEASCGQISLTWLILASRYSPKVVMNVI
jgi:hypothetical protein